MPVDVKVPPGIDLERHANLGRRSGIVWARRAALVVIAAIPLLGLLNTFGQRGESTEEVSARASLVVNSPSRLRGGLIFTTEIVVTPHRDIDDGRLYLDNGWFRNMSLNAIAPQPSNQSAQGDWQIWEFGSMKAGQPFTVFVSWQTNPTNLGSQPETVQLYDGDTHIMTIHRSRTVFP